MEDDRSSDREAERREGRKSREGSQSPTQHDHQEGSPNRNQQP